MATRVQIHETTEARNAYGQAYRNISSAVIEYLKDGDLRDLPIPIRQAVDEFQDTRERLNAALVEQGLEGIY